MIVQPFVCSNVIATSFGSLLSLRRAIPTLFGVFLIAALASPVAAQDANQDSTQDTNQDSPVGALAGTLKKIRDTKTITLGYRESSLPFSYLNHRAQPIGYSVDLCQEVIEQVASELDGMDITIAYMPVTSADRFDKIRSGAVDLECGSTTNSLQRQKDVAFSPVFFVAGTKLMVPKTSAVRSYRDLAGKTAAVTAGTTNEGALRALSDKQQLGINIVTARDHAESFALLTGGKADTFATDDILLYGIIATEPAAHDMKVVGDYLSYDPYGLVFRRDDPSFAAVVDRAFLRMARTRRLAELYNKWFVQRLPTGETLNLPMSPHLQEVFQVLGQPE
jgi:glutamate/aspartate transport system substrate-binding protein